MLRHILALGASATALALAFPAAGQSDTTPMPPIVTGTWGVDLTQLDPAVKPGDDFNAYVNGKWIAANPVPPQLSWMGVVPILRENTRANVRQLVDTLVASNPAPGTSERRVADAYAAFMNTDAIEAAGMTRAAPYLQRIAQAPDLASLLAVSATPGFPTLVGPSITVDDKEPTHYAVEMDFNGMGLPSREYYLDSSPKAVAIQQAYRGLLALVLGKAGYQDPAGTADQVYAFEHKVAELEWSPAMVRNADLTYNVLSADELHGLVPGFPIDAILAAGEVSGTQRFQARQMPPTPEEIARLGLTPADMTQIGGGLPAMMKLVSETPLPVLKAYLTAHFLMGHAAVMPRAIDEANFAVFGKLISGQKEQQARWKRAIGAVEGEVGELLGASYVAKYFPPANKTAMVQLVGNLRQAMKLNIQDSPWMSPATKAQAQAKLAAFDPRIGYPDKFKTYDGLVIVPDNPLANSMAAAKWAYEYDVNRRNGPVDRTEWPIGPETVNAFYSPNFNSITFPAAYLQPPNFNPSADPAVNYGAIGATIGHEMGHGFDDQGSKYDGTGALKNWWTETDRKRFDALTARLAAQYNSYCPLDAGKTCVNGRLTLGENIGDLAGIEMAYRAYHLSLGGKPAPVIDGLTGDQRFFLSYAQSHRAIWPEAFMRNLILTDPHAPDMYRVNGVLRNVDAWYAAFNVKPGDALYLPPSQRVHIW